MKYYIGVLFLLVSCATAPVDLATVDLHQPGELEKQFVATERVEQRGHFEIDRTGGAFELIMVDKGEVLTSYRFEGKESKQIVYHGSTINPEWVNKVALYKGKIGYIDLMINDTDGIASVERIMQQWGTPTDIIHNELNKETVDGTIHNFVATFTTIATSATDEYGAEVIRFPERMFWDKQDYIYCLTINGITTAPQIQIIAKDAFRDRVILGFHNPDADVHLAKYLK